MKRVHVHIVAPPGNHFSTRGYFQTREIDDRSSWSVLTRNPFRIHQRHRPRRRSHCHARMKKFARRFGRIDAERDW